MLRIFSVLIVQALMAVFALPLLAQVTQAPVKDPQPIIEVQSTDPSDSHIDARIENIFSKIEGISAVTVEVESGVVTLSGSVANEALAIDAMDIAIRTAGVVTVEDEINRTLGISR